MGWTQARLACAPPDNAVPNHPFLSINPLESSMTAQATLANGRPQRKLLSEQLDRLDSVIDGLCDGLPEAIAAAAREGTRAAVKDSILEVMTNPELRALFQNSATVAPAAPAPSEPVVTGPSLWTRI